MIKDCFHLMVTRLDEWHNQNLDFFPFSSDTTDPLLLNLELLAHANYEEWHYEDLAKMSKDDNEVLHAYRMTVVCNRQRGKSIEAIEQYFFDLQGEEGEVCSESMGMIFDRLSILHLKKLHAQTVAPEKVALLEPQITGLLEAAENLHKGILNKTKRCLVFSHLKIYSPK